MSRFAKKVHKCKCLVADITDGRAVKIVLDRPDNFFKGNNEVLIVGHVRLDYDDAVKLANWIKKQVEDHKLIRRSK